MTAAKKSATKTATKSASKTAAKTPRTAKPGETEAAHRARMDRIAVETDGRTARQHAEHPEDPTDSTVRHAEPPTGKDDGSGEGGFPSGEYDVAEPAKAGPGPDQSDPVATAVDAHLASHDQEAIDALHEDAKLTAEELTASIEALPVGGIIEHEGPNRWRASVRGQNRFGHGQTAQLAVESYVLAEVVTVDDAAATAFAALPADQQDEIRKRDEIIANRGTDTLERSRQEALARREAASRRTTSKGKTHRTK